MSTPNLEDIAKLARVSRSTVSRVLNDHPNVSEDTRTRVLQVLQEQKYRPNLAARALVTHQTRTISLVIPQSAATTFSDPYFGMLIQGMMMKANEADYAVMLWVGNGVEEESRFRDRVLRNHLFDGVIVASAVMDDQLVPHLYQSRVPFVIVGPAPIPDIPHVDVDNQRAAQVAVSHLVHLGYKRIGMIAGPQNMGAAVARVRGYRQALERAGRPIDETLIVIGNFDEVSGYLRMRTLLQRGIDAVFAASDMMAIGAMRAAHERGMRVPHDVAIVGFDDLPLAAALQPALTTVRQPIQELGLLATQMLLDILSGTVDKPNPIILPAQLIIRDTCGASRL